MISKLRLHAAKYVNKARMSTRPNSRGVQDIPPAGGYPAIPLERVMSARGPSGLMLWVGAIFATFYGLHLVNTKIF